MSKPLYIFAGGGTGGHLYPGLAVAEALLKLCDNAAIVFACSDRPIDRRILDPTPYAIVPQPVRPLPRSVRGAMAFAGAFARSARQARALIHDLRPTAVLGLGGFAAAPVVRRAAAEGVPTGLLNPDAMPGRANRLLARRVDVIFTQFEMTAEYFPSRVRSKIRCVGCPIRSAFRSASREAALKYFDLNPYKKVLLVFGGSLLAVPVSKAVAHLASELADCADNWQVLHISDACCAEEFERRLTNYGLEVQTVTYCHQMEQAYAAADLVVARGGAGTIAELAATGTPSILLPYPYHADQHQRLNAAELVTSGAAIICEDTREAVTTGENLKKAILPLLTSEDALARMTLEAACAARPHAAEQIAVWLVGASTSGK